MSAHHTHQDTHSTQVMGVVGEQYRQSGLAKRDALVGGLPELHSRSIRLVDAGAIALVAAAVLLLVGERVRWNHPTTDIAIGAVVGIAWWFVGPAARGRLSRR